MSGVGINIGHLLFRDRKWVFSDRAVGLRVGVGINIGYSGIKSRSSFYL